MSRGPSVLRRVGPKASHLLACWSADESSLLLYRKVYEITSHERVQCRVQKSSRSFESYWAGTHATAGGKRILHPAYKMIAQLGRELTPPAEGILSRTLYADDKLKVVGFG